MPAASAYRDLAPWFDRAGRLSWLKLAVFIAALLPGLWLAYNYATNEFDTKPITTLIHETGLWAVRFLAATLAVTPFRRIFSWPRLIMVRRQLGLTVLTYTIIHLCFYVVDEGFDLWLVVNEILRRFYLGIGFIGFMVLLLQGVTSNDGAIRRMGTERWNILHRFIYPALAVILIHFLLQSKLDVTEACLMLGLFVTLLLYRVAHAAGLSLNPLVLAGIAAVAGSLTALWEAGWYASGGRISFWLVLASNLDPLSTTRPGWWVAIAGLAVAVLALLRSFLSPARTPQRQHAPHRA